MRRFSFWLIFSALLLLSCNPKPLSREALNAYVLDVENGLRKIIEKNGVKLDLSYRPKDLVIAQEVASNDPDQWKAVSLRLDSLDYFILRLSRNGKEIETSYAGVPAAYTSVISYLSDGIAHDIQLKVQGQVIPLESVAFVPSFGSSNTTSLLLIFKSNLKTRSGDILLIFNDQKFGTGLNEFSFENQPVKNVPGLVL
jgi:hypothetical protein